MEPNKFPCETLPTGPKKNPRSYIDIGRNVPSARDAWQKGNHPIHENNEVKQVPPDQPLDEERTEEDE